MRGVTVTRLVMLAALLHSAFLRGPAVAQQTPPEEPRSAPATSTEVTARRRALQTAGAVAANTVPVASAFVEPKCIQGYILCKAMFAVFSVAAAAESVVMSGGRDHDQPRGILTKGFTGDWVVTRSDVAGSTKVELLPEVAPPASGEDKGGGFVPPPL
jgi:hypothetical protein